MSKKNWNLALLDVAKTYLEYKKSKTDTNFSNHVNNLTASDPHDEECIKLVDNIEHAYTCTDTYCK